MQHDPDHAEPGLVHPEVAAALGRLAELAATRQPEEAVLPEFLERYYRELPEPDLDDRRLDALYSVAVAHFGIGRQRRPGETLVRVVSPDTGLDESRPPRSLLFVVTDDAPFLVDTTRMVVERHRLDIHLMVHPMLDVARDADGVVTRVGRDAGPTEAWTQVEIDYCDAAAAAGRLEADALAAVADVHLVVEDFPEMRDRMAALAEHDPIMKWLAYEHFVFLGAAGVRPDRRRSRRPRRHPARSAPRRARDRPTTRRRRRTARVGRHLAQRGRVDDPPRVLAEHA